MNQGADVVVYAEMFAGSTPCAVRTEGKPMERPSEHVMNEVLRALSLTDEDEIHDYILAATLENRFVSFSSPFSLLLLLLALLVLGDYKAQKLVAPACGAETKALIDSVCSQFNVGIGLVKFVSGSERTWDLVKNERMFNLFACAVWAATPKKNLQVRPISGGRRHFR
jgi:hypothetical protein